jgi:hypothetical protein
MKVKVSMWFIVAAIVAVGYYLWKKQRDLANAAVTASARTSAGAQQMANDPIIAAKAAADATLTGANQLAAAIRANPGLGGLLGIAKETIDRLTLSNDSYAKLYNSVTVNRYGDIRTVK